MVSILNENFELVCYDGGNDGYNAEQNILLPPPVFHCSKQPRNCNLIIRCTAGDFTLVHLALLGPTGCTAPVRGALVWVSDEQPSIEATQDLNDNTTDAWEVTKERCIQAVEKKLPGGPVAFIECDETTLEGSCNFQKPFPSGRFMLIKFLRGAADENIDIFKLWILGFVGPDHRAQAEALPQPVAFPESFHLLSEPLRDFQELHQRTRYPLCSDLHLVIFSRDQPREEVYRALEAAAPQLRRERGVVVLWVGAGSDPTKAHRIARKLGVDVEKYAIRLVDNQTERKFAPPASMDPTRVDEVLSFLADVTSGRVHPYRLSAPRPEGDADPRHPGLTVVTGNTFEELLLDPAVDAFMDAYADWSAEDTRPSSGTLIHLAVLVGGVGAGDWGRCMPCQVVGPMVTRLAALVRHPTLRICKIDVDANQLPPEYCPEDFIPLLKMFPAGPTPKQPVSFEGPRTLEGLATFIHQHMTTSPKFDLEALLPTLRQEDAEMAVRHPPRPPATVAPCRGPELRRALHTLEDAIEAKNIARVEEGHAACDPLEAKYREMMLRKSIEALGPCKRVASPQELQTAKEEADRDQRLLVIYAMKASPHTAGCECGCREDTADTLSMDEVFGELARSMSHVAFVKADICTGEMETLAGQLGLEEYPSFIFWHRGAEARRIVIGSAQEVRAAIEAILAA
ncbi:hypothetical protein PAPYR_3746 [Paratrimastix pyriformis]|uniref:protein disulfide-isomerase n=1 Tax=Paratrimastix pyriformis TaxID=342808 RepID=A0ABQ8ULF6_9EUKA|nr:hypothetical protein PAPYR_3746 [Paratrimastix pyriformis]